MQGDNKLVLFHQQTSSN